MLTPSKISKNLVLVLLLLLTIACVFWFSSRYPALNQKALMGGESPIEGLGFDNTYETTPNDSVIEVILRNTLNWAVTNKKGMIFGIIFAAALMLLFSLLHKRQFKNKFLNSLLGMFIGTPLGVCVNCAAPIAQGMHDSGAKTETTLATMVSSPTLNVVVLGIMLSLLPIHMVLIKLAVTFTVILLVIPLITHFFGAEAPQATTTTQLEKVQPKSKTSSILLSLAPIGMGSNSWPNAIKWLIKSYLISLWHLIKVTVPLMLLAGLLGNILITLLPWNQILAIIPANEGFVITCGIMLMIALIGVFLPVPISFDVIISAVLLALGMPEKYVTIFLVTLGIFSVYSFFIVWQAISKKIALAMFFSIAILGICSGWAGQMAGSWYKQNAKKKYETFFKESPNNITLASFKPVNTAKNTSLVTDSLIFKETLSESGSIKISSLPFLENKSTNENSFLKIDGPSIGLPHKTEFTFNDMLEPFAQGKGISSADINNDGWPDLLFASESGLEVALNINGERFKTFELDSTRVSNEFITNAILVDMNNDGWKDIVFTVYREGYFLWHNNYGEFNAENLTELPSPKGAIAGTGLSIGDIDHDGDLDILIGNWSVGWYINVNNSYNSSNDVLLINDGVGNFTMKELSGVPGETLSSLITDFNGDGHQDIIICNDYGVPDKYLLGNGTSNFTPIVRADSIIPYTTHFSMSTTTADIDNDLIPEIYNTSISGIHLDMEYRSKEASEICSSIVDPELRKQCEKATQAYLQITNYSLNPSLPCSEGNELACLGYALYWSGKRSRSIEETRSLCSWIPEAMKDLYFKNCEYNFDLDINGYAYLDTLIPTKKQTNTFFKKNNKGRFDELSTKYGLKYSGWSWNAKFADLDNDEYQDIYITNGFVMNSTQHSNLIYFNQSGETFIDKTQELDMIDFSPTNSYVYIDYDRDGDLDIISAPKIGPLTVYNNQLRSGNSIAFELQDQQGNTQGISATITIHYGDKKHQMREVQAGGGFRSSDGYTLYFGLGSNSSIERVTIKWSTGEVDEINTSLTAGHVYKLTREGSNL